MVHSPRHGLIPVRQLSDADRSELKALVTSCSQCDKTTLPLYLKSSTSNETHHFLRYQHGALVGVAMAPPDDPVEVLGMVHPEHRRQGIGRTLLDAVRDECRRREVASLLLVCEGSIPPGIAFACAVGAAHEFSEFRMELDRAAFAQCPSPHRTLELRPASVRDLDALVGLWTASRDVAEDEAQEVTLRWLNQDNQRLYIGWLDGEPVGMLRLHLDPASVFINSFRVYPRSRGRGYGRQILMGVIDRLLAEGWKQIMIEVATDNSVALSLYESCGFQKVAEYLYYGLAA